MRTPEALETLVEYGIIEEVLRPLMSGKEAQIYLVISDGERRVASGASDGSIRVWDIESSRTVADWRRGVLVPRNALGRRACSVRPLRVTIAPAR